MLTYRIEEDEDWEEGEDEERDGDINDDPCVVRMRDMKPHACRAGPYVTAGYGFGTRAPDFHHGKSRFMRRPAASFLHSILGVRVWGRPSGPPA